MPWRQQQFDVCGKLSRLEALSYRQEFGTRQEGFDIKYAVSQVVGYIKGRSAIHVARVYGERKRNFVGQHFWAGGYYISTVGRDERVIRGYIRHQGAEDQRLEQLNLWR